MFQLGELAVLGILSFGWSLHLYETNRPSTVDPKVGKVPNPMRRRPKGVGNSARWNPPPILLPPLLYHTTSRKYWIDITNPVFRCTTESGHAVHYCRNRRPRESCGEGGGRVGKAGVRSVTRENGSQGVTIYVIILCSRQMVDYGRLRSRDKGRITTAPWELGGGLETCQGSPYDPARYRAKRTSENQPRVGQYAAEVQFSIANKIKFLLKVVIHDRGSPSGPLVPIIEGPNEACRAECIEGFLRRIACIARFVSKAVDSE